MARKRKQPDTPEKRGKRRWLLAAFAASVGISVIYAMGPYRAVGDIEQAIIDRDTETLSKRVDFDALRAEAFASAMQATETDLPVLDPDAERTEREARIGMVQPSVDAYLSADGVIRLVHDHLNLDVANTPRQMGWISGMRFAVAVEVVPGDPLIVELRMRNGRWTVIDAALPNSAL